MNFQMKNSCGLLLTLSLTLGSSAFAAAKTDGAETIVKAKKIKVAPADLLAYSAADWNLDSTVEAAMKANAGKADRAVAGGANYTEADLSPQLRQFRKDFFAIKTADQLQAKLVELQQNYGSYPDDMKYVAAQLQLLRPYRGIVYRATKIFESTGVTRSFAVTMIRNAATDLNIYLPSENWTAGFDYLVAPSPNPSENYQFQSVTEMQGYMREQVYPNVAGTLKALVDILKTNKAPFLWDKQLVYGPESFKDNMNRFRVVSPAEMARVISSLHMTMHGLLSFSSYNFDEFFLLTKSQYRLRELDVAGGMAANQYRISKWSRTGILNKYPTYMTLQPKGREDMKTSWEHLNQAVVFLKASFKNVQDGKEDVFGDSSFLPSAKILPHQHALKSQLDKWEEMVAGEAKLHSVATGETVTVNLKNLYANAPKDLKAFWPTGFDDGPNSKWVTTTDGKKIEYRNYFRGQATAWNQGAYAPYLKFEGSQNPASALKIVNQAWGGAAVALPLRIAVE